MIPIKLEFQAFGPYVTEQSIDFTKLKDKLFLISGQTGSGKTTIFDAITFALFGQPSGSIRSNEWFKCDFSDDNTTCYVRMKFYVKGKYFTVYREPSQKKIKRNGNVTKSLPVAELTLPNGEVITSITAINEMIKSTLGIDCEQFKKITMLPQGEFRKFLSEKTSSKQETLRQIFKTEIFEQFTRQLAEQVSTYKQQLTEINNLIQGSIDNIKYNDNSELANACTGGAHNVQLILQELSLYNAELSHKKTVLHDKISALNQRLTDINLPYFIEINNTFQQLDVKKSKLDKLLMIEEDYKQKQQHLTLLKSIKEISQFYSKVSEVKSTILELTEKSIKLRKTIFLNNNELEILKPIYVAAEQKSKSIVSIASQIETLKHKFKIIDSIEELIHSNSDKANLIELNNKKVRQLSTYAEYMNLNLELDDINDKISKLKQTDLLLLKHNDTLVEYSSISQKYKVLFDKFLINQASILSATLVEAMPCPVCGSTTHPSPAHISKESVTQEMLDSCKNEFDEITRKLEQSQNECIVSFMTLGITDFEKNSDELAHQLMINQNEKNRLTEKIKCLDTKQFSYTIDQTQQHIIDICQAILIDEQTIKSQSLQIDKLKVDLDNKELTKELILSEICDKQSEIEQINKHFTETLNRLAMLNDNAIRSKEALNQTNEYILNQQQLLEQYEDNLEFAFKQFDVTAKIYEQHISEISKIELYANEINEYNSNISACKGIITSLNEQLKGKTPVNLIALQNEHDLLESDILSANNQLEKLVPILSINTTIEQSVNKNISQSEIIEEKYKCVFEIYNVANGNRSDKISFESYILSFYFNKVIINANIHLVQMTSNRYTLVIRQEKEKFGAYSGLELNVFDSYTGKQRDVITLSGGESFMVALSLSLGLADITCEYSGSIEINTLFIDEGFGSLDSESIDSAMDCLNSLRLRGRYIGVISHVAELKEKISAKINITQLPTGSNITTSF